jgi:hypothetical protein
MNMALAASLCWGGFRGFSLQSVARSSEKLRKDSRARTWSFAWSRLYSVGKFFQLKCVKLLVIDSKMLLVRLNCAWIGK